VKPVIGVGLTLLSVGAKPAAPLWLNTRSSFAVQEWPCD